MLLGLLLVPLAVVHPAYGNVQWIAILLASVVQVFYMFKWAQWGSEHWPSLGKPGNFQALTKKWRNKSVLAFLLLGVALLDPITMWIGFRMGKAGQIYFDELTPELPDSIQRAEWRIGDLYSTLTIVPICVAAIKTIWGA